MRLASGALVGLLPGDALGSVGTFGWMVGTRELELDRVGGEALELVASCLRVIGH